MKSRALASVGRAVRYAQGIVGLRSSDVILASFPRSGNTWVRFFFRNLISELEEQGAVVDFSTLDETMPELGVDNLLRPWPYASVPRIVKTHLPYMRRFAANRSILVVRDPCDAMVSYHRYLGARSEAPYRGSLSEFLRHPKYGLEAWFRHYRSWRESRSLEIAFETLKDDDERQFGEMLRLCAVDVPPPVLHSAVERSRFRKLRAVEERYGHSKPGFFSGEQRFTRSGRAGGGQEQFASADLEWLDSLYEKYGIERPSRR